MFLHRRIATNDFLFKIGLKQADSCSFCGEFTETLAHLFWYCSYTQKFWKDIYQWITQNTILNKSIAFSSLICLGLIDNISDLLLHHLFVLPPKKTLMWRKHCSIGQSCCSMTSNRSIGLISRKFSSMKFLYPSVRLTNQRPRAFVSAR